MNNPHSIEDIVRNYRILTQPGIPEETGFLQLQWFRANAIAIIGTLIYRITEEPNDDTCPNPEGGSNV